MRVVAKILQFPGGRYRKPAMRADGSRPQRIPEAQQSQVVMGRSRSPLDRALAALADCGPSVSFRARLDLFRQVLREEMAKERDAR